MTTTRNQFGHLLRPFADVAERETIHAHGVPLTITTTATTAPSESAGQVTYMVGTYLGADDLTPGAGLYPFVRRYGDDWTIQRRTDLAVVKSYDDGKTWNAPV